jgi:predicted nucleic acid-binding protein
MRKVISNTTPIITLLTISKLDLLQKIYGQIIIPKGVFDEIEQGKDKIFYTNLSKIDWIKIIPIKDIEPLKYLHELDKGEAEVIVLANELNADLVIIDERLGREFAEYFNIKVTGTIGVLLKAKELGLIKMIKPILNQMLESGIWLNKTLIDKVLEIAVEN